MRSESADLATKSPRWWQLSLAGLLHAALVYCSFAPLDFWWLTLVGISPLVWAAERGAARPLRTALCVAPGVIPLWPVNQAWVIDISAVGYVPLCITLTTFGAGYVYLHARVRRRWRLLPAAVIAGILWTGIEVFRGDVLLTGYPWLLIGYPLINLPVAGAAAVFGVYALSCLAATFGAFLLDLRYARTALWHALVMPVATVLVLTGASAWAVNLNAAQRSPGFVASIVQTNVPQDNKTAWTPEQRKSDWLRFEELIRQAAEAGPDVIVLPETMFPGLALNTDAVEEQRRARIYWSIPDSGDGMTTLPFEWFADRLLALQEEVATPIIVGAVSLDGLRITSESGQIRTEFDATYNSVFVAEHGRIDDDRYDKIRLTPFGEIIPIVWRWPWLQQQLLVVGAGGMTFELSFGTRAQALEFEARDGRTIRVVTPICFEAVYGGVCRRLVVEAGPGPLVNMTNDGWFGGNAAARAQHLQIARWRCIELASPMIRAANTGISAVIGPDGRVIDSGVGSGRERIGIDGVLTAEVPGASTLMTPYARGGHLFRWCAIGAMCVLVALSFARRHVPIADPTHQTPES